MPPPSLKIERFTPAQSPVEKMMQSCTQESGRPLKQSAYPLVNILRVHGQLFPYWRVALRSAGNYTPVSTVCLVCGGESKLKGSAPAGADIVPRVNMHTHVTYLVLFVCSIWKSSPVTSLRRTRYYRAVFCHTKKRVSPWQLQRGIDPHACQVLACTRFRWSSCSMPGYDTQL